MDLQAVENAIASAAEGVLAERGVPHALITKGVLVFEYLDEDGERYLGYGWTNMRAWEILGMISFVTSQIEVYDDVAQDEPEDED